MRILVINCGSSSLRFELLALESCDSAPNRLAKGSIANVGASAELRFRAARSDELRTSAEIFDHRQATTRAVEWLRATGLLDANPDAIGHRIVHGGPHLFNSTIIDEQVIHEITAAGELAPLHNHASLEAIDAAREAMGDDVPMVAVFDTAFHHGLPQRAACYAIPPDLSQNHSIRRYGFHGLAHRCMAEKCIQYLSQPVEQGKLITLQLGGGCSATAVMGGKSVDTSMGFTPLEGLVMGTRSGDIDPSGMRYLCEHAGMTPAEVEDCLNHRSGLLGVSGATANVSELLKLEAGGHARAKLALEMFCYRLRKYIGAYLMVLEGADAIVFGGGIGENSAEIRSRICHHMAWCGLSIDEQKNRQLIGKEGEVSAAGSKIRAFVIPVDEELVIAKDTVDCLLAQNLKRERSHS